MRGPTLAFPRYGQSVAADIAAEALHGEHGDLASSVYAMATLFALDRAGAVHTIQGLCRGYDVVILDRYVASNAAYSAARLHENAAGKAAAWVQRIEFARLGVAQARLAGAPCGLCRARPGNDPAAVPSVTPVGRATITNATLNFSSAPVRSTPSWRPKGGAAGGWLSAPMLIRAD
ncbi:thymidylate kinase [Mycobacterium tuberculosis RGTB327]|nr:thymidylate kinase [Mycobacterium tuberculosis RGTB327]